MYFADIPPENSRSQITQSQFTVSCLKTKCPTKETVSKKPHKLYIKSFLSRKTFILIWESLVIVKKWYWLKASTAFHHPAKASSAGLLPSFRS